MAQKKQTVGSYLFDYLYKQQGIKHAFGIPGDFALPMFRWLQASEIDLITMTHEPSVGFAADAYARINGLGLACVTYCVGGLNMVNSIACAYAEKSPVIVLSGAPSMKDRHNDPLIHHKVKTFDSQRKIFEEVTCATAVLSDIDTAAAEIARVVETVKAQCRPGYIEVPYDLVDQIITNTSVPTVKPDVTPEDKEALEASLKEAAEMISKAKKPVLIADVELHRHGLTDFAVDFATALNIPIASTMISKSIIRETNPLYIGVYGGGLSEEACQAYVESSDCVIMLGAFVSDVFLGWYTAQMERKRMIIVTTEKVQVGLHRYDGVTFKSFLKGLQKMKIKAKPAFKNPYKPETYKKLTKADLKKPLCAKDLFRVIGLHLNKNHTLVCDTGDSLVGAVGLRTMKRNMFISDAYYLSMGFAVPASMGIMAGLPKEKVFVLVGDGSFQMTGMELSTAAKYGFKPIVIIINNNGFGTQRHIIDGEFNNIHMWKYTKVKELLHYGKAYRATTVEEMDNAVKDALESNTMAIIEAVIPTDDCSPTLKRLGEALGKLRDVKKK